MWRLPRPILVLWLFRAPVCIMTFLLAGIILDMAQVPDLVFILLYDLGGIDPNRWIISLPFFLAFFGVRGLGLRLISGRQRVMGLSLFFVPIKSLIALFLIGIVLVFLYQRPVSFQTPEINLPRPGEWLEADLCFCINVFLYYCISRIQVLPSIV